jgi:MerR family mercuric resistance operon transcriptional regulator
MMEPMTIGTLAKVAGVGVETIRFYESKGLIERPSYKPGSGYRKYDPVNITKLTFILRAKNLGFSLKEIKDLLNLRAGSKAKCASVKSKAEAKIEEVLSKISDLIAIRTVLEKLVLTCSAEIPSSICPIIEALEQDKI